MKGTKWTPEEIAIAEDADLSHEVVARLVFRTPRAVKQYRYDVLLPQGRWSAPNPLYRAPRPVPSKEHPEWIIAQTCRICGELKPREAFRVVRNGYVQKHCRACKVERTVAYMQKIQERTLPTATRHRAPWTFRDVAIAMRTDLSVEERARILGRTAAAVMQAIDRYEAQPKRGGGKRPSKRKTPPPLPRGRAAWLLAQSCTVCHRFQQRDAFKLLSTGYLERRCDPCRKRAEQEKNRKRYAEPT